MLRQIKLTSIMVIVVSLVFFSLYSYAKTDNQQEILNFKPQEEMPETYTASTSWWWR